MGLMCRPQAVFRSGDPRTDIFIVERGSVASRGRMLGPGGLMGLKLALLHGTAEHGGKPQGELSLEDGAATWDHTAVSLSYVNMLTLRCQDFDKYVMPCKLTCMANRDCCDALTPHT